MNLLFSFLLCIESFFNHIQIVFATNLRIKIGYDKDNGKKDAEN